MEDTQTWLFVIEVGTSRLRNNVSLLHRGSETNGDILFDATLHQNPCGLRNRRDNGTVKLGETICISAEVLFFAIISLQAFEKGG